MKSKFFLLAFALLLAGKSVQAKITLPSVLSDNMVLQQKTEAAVWGTAEPGRKVVIRTSWDKNKIIAESDPQSGKWFARVSTPEAGGPYEISISDGEKTTLKNVLIGEVWYCSGQSNMEMPVKGYGSQPVLNGADAIVNARASRPIRICNIKKASSKKPLETSEGTWQENTPEIVANTSATAYFFADALQKAIEVPVGIIVSAWGGSSIETWMTREVIEKDFPEFKLDYLDNGREIIKKDIYQLPCLLYNGQVNPIVPFTFKGMLWYQGEQNRPNPGFYVRLQTAYAKMMRELFNVPDAPFYFVQIAPYSYDNGRKTHSGYFCEAQAKTLLSIAHSGMCTTSDIGEYGTIHPRYKQEVGKRLALLALKHDYGMDAVEADAPSYKSAEFKGSEAYITFNVGWLGLSPMGSCISGFEIAGADRVFYPASACLHKNKIIKVSSPEVPEPVAVRYCWRNWSVGGVYNNFGIVAGPFRTDDWPLNPKDWE